MKKHFWIFLLFFAVSSVSTAATNEIGNSFGIGGGINLAIQNAYPMHPGILSLKAGRELPNGLMGEGELDGMIYDRPGSSAMDIRMLGFLKFVLGEGVVQPYLLSGLGFALQWGTEGNGLLLFSFDLAAGGGLQFRLSNNVFLYMETKPSLLLRYQYPTAIDSPLTGGLIFSY